MFTVIHKEAINTPKVKNLFINLPFEEQIKQISIHQHLIISTSIGGKLYLGDANSDHKSMDLIIRLGHFKCECDKNSDHTIQVDINDDGQNEATEGMRRDLQFCVNYIAINLMQNKKVLVHCSQGVSRSATIVLAFLITKCGLNFETSLNYVKSKRFQVNPKINFIMVLQSLPSSLVNEDHQWSELSNEVKCVFSEMTHNERRGKITSGELWNCITEESKKRFINFKEANN